MNRLVYRVRDKLNRIYSQVTEPEIHQCTKELRQYFCGKRVAVVNFAGKPCDPWTGRIDYVRYDPPTAGFCEWGTHEANIVFGFAWDGEPDENGVEGIELIWGLDEIELI